jgi:hypothetical protein
MPPLIPIADFCDLSRPHAWSIRHAAALLLVFLGSWLFIAPETFLTADPFYMQHECKGACAGTERNQTGLSKSSRQPAPSPGPCSPTSRF